MALHYQQFQSTLPVRGATRNLFFQFWNSLRFQSTLPVRGATDIIGEAVQRTLLFQSTLPVRGATHTVSVAHLLAGISIHAPREGSDGFCRFLVSQLGISIHAPREGSDQRGQIARDARLDISIHAPREGSDALICFWLRGSTVFQSTLPVRGATPAPMPSAPL